MANGFEDFKKRQREEFARAKKARGAAGAKAPPAAGLRAKVQNATTPSAAKPATKLGLRRVANVAGKVAAPLALADTAFKTANTPTEDFRTRFGLETDSPSLAGDIGVRALGAASELGDSLTLGLAGDKLFRDRQKPVAPTAVAGAQQPVASGPTLRRNAAGQQEEVSSITSPTGGTGEISGAPGLRRRITQQSGGTEGGGTLSVVGGRSAGEQAAIDQNVARIDSQTNAIREARAANLGIPLSTLSLIDSGSSVAEVKQAVQENPELATPAAPTRSEALNELKFSRQLGRDRVEDANTARTASRAGDAIVQGKIDRLSTDKETGEIDPSKQQFFDGLLAGVDPDSEEFADAITFAEIAQVARPRAEAATGLVDESGLTGNLLDTLTGGIFEDSTPGPQTLEELQAEVKTLASSGKFLGQDIEMDELPASVKKRLNLIKQAQTRGRAGLRR